MKTRLCLLLMTLCLPGFSGAGPADDHPYDADPIEIWGRERSLYMRGDANEAIECYNGSRNVAAECGSLPVSGFTGLIFWDCSDSQFECLYDGGVLAVPRTDLAIGQKYTVFGALLTVERCFSDQAPCDTAMISSECVFGATCRCRFGQTTVFYYSRERGITAFYQIGSAPVPVDPKFVADAIPLNTYVLIAKHGFLRVPLALRKATSEDYCG